MSRMSARGQRIQVRLAVLYQWITTSSFLFASSWPYSCAHMPARKRVFSQIANVNYGAVIWAISFSATSLILTCGLSLYFFFFFFGRLVCLFAEFVAPTLPSSTRHQARGQLGLCASCVCGNTTESQHRRHLISHREGITQLMKSFGARRRLGGGLAWPFWLKVGGFLIYGLNHFRQNPKI